MRIAEIMSDFRNLQYYIAQIQANPPPEDYYLEGYTLLRSVITEAQAVLASPYSSGSGSHPQGDPETEKSQLRAYVRTLPKSANDLLLLVNLGSPCSIPEQFW
jgi:hypothetical protein